MLTHVDEAAGVVERAEVRSREREEGVQFGQQGLHLRPRDGGPDDDVAERVADEADLSGVETARTHVEQNLRNKLVRHRVEVGERVALWRTCLW